LMADFLLMVAATVMGVFTSAALVATYIEVTYRYERWRRFRRGFWRA
jgi:mannose/fructose/N-acetylgalactosamine-specific phosphotransferase system component IID